MASRLFAAAAAAVAAAAPSSPLARGITRRCVPGFQGRCWYSEKVNFWWDPNNSLKWKPTYEKVNCWEDPKNPVMWKANHFVAVTLTVWVVCLYGGFKIFGGEKTAEVSEARAKKK